MTQIGAGRAWQLQGNLGSRMHVIADITQPTPDPDTIRDGLMSFGRQSFQFAALLCSLAAGNGHSKHWRHRWVGSVAGAEWVCESASLLPPLSALLYSHVSRQRQARTVFSWIG